MKNTNILLAVLILATSGLVCLLWMKNNRKTPLTFGHTLDLAGQPDQLERKRVEKDHLENSKMVSEGSQFGVQYYNQMAKEEREELKKKAAEKNK